MKKILRIIAIIISILIILITIFIYFKMKTAFNGILGSNDSYTNLSMLITSGFYYGTLVVGLIFLAIIWIEYILICLSMKIYSKYIGLKRNLLLFFLILIIFILFIVVINACLILFGVAFYTIVFS